MKLIDEIRRENLAKLRADLGGLGSLAEKLERSDSQVSQWINASENSGTGKPRGMRSETARYIERLCGKSVGWMDTDHSSGDASDSEVLQKKSNVSEIKKRAKVPLISLIQAGEMTDVLDLFHPGEAVHWVEALYTNPSRGCYSLKVEGDSMENPIQGAQTFLEGTILIVDPNAASGPNDYVIAKDVATQRATFKKLTTDGVRWYLKPLNPTYQTIEIDDPALRVIGKVIEFQPPGGKL